MTGDMLCDMIDKFIKFLVEKGLVYREGSLMHYTEDGSSYNFENFGRGWVVIGDFPPGDYLLWSPDSDDLRAEWSSVIITEKDKVCQQWKVDKVFNCFRAYGFKVPSEQFVELDGIVI